MVSPVIRDALLKSRDVAGFGDFGTACGDFLDAGDVERRELAGGHGGEHGLGGGVFPGGAGGDAVEGETEGAGEGEAGGVHAPARVQRRAI